MTLRSRALAATTAITLAFPVNASDQILGEAATFQSPNGVTERCVQITPMPGAVYSDKDRQAEAAFCTIDFYAPAVALCPKTWSTSPGMIVYDITEGPYANDRKGFEANACVEGKGASDLARDDLAKFKPTMNAKGRFSSSAQ